MMRIFKYFLFTFLIAPSSAWAAACCGGSFSLPSILVGDDRAQFTASLATAETPVEVTGLGWQNRTHPETSQTLRLEGASLLSDRWQLGGSLPVVRRARTGPDGDETAAGVGDVALDVAYEALPEWDYSPWKPKGIAYFQVAAPTGRSRFESRQDLNLDITGRGLWTIGPGLILTKIVLPFDLGLTLETHRSFSRSLESPALGGTVDLAPSWGASASLAAGYNRGDFRLGVGLSTNYEDAIAISGATSTPIALERFTTLAASVAYLYDVEWASALSYSDQTILGSPSNTTLSRTILLSLQRRWQR